MEDEGLGEPLLRGRPGTGHNGRGLSVAALAARRPSPPPQRGGSGGAATIAATGDIAASAAPPYTRLQPARVTGGLRFAPGTGKMPERQSRAGSLDSSDGGRTPSNSFIAGGRDATASAVLHRSASTKLLRLAATYQSRAALEEEGGFRMPRGVLHPYDARAGVWWSVIALAVLASAALEPLFLAFAEHPGPYPLLSGPTLCTAALLLVYAADVAVNLRVAFFDDDGVLVTDHTAIAARYAATTLGWDLLTTVPWDWIVLVLLGMAASTSDTARYIGMLRLLRLGRAYRLRRWVSYLTHSTSFSLFGVTLVRNALVLFYTTHIGACLFYFVARQSGGSAVEAWGDAARGAFAVGDDVHQRSIWSKYIFSLYFATVTFATVGFGDIHATTEGAAAFVTLYIYGNVFIGAYIIGTITLLVTRADEEAGRYRSDLTALEAFGATHSVPPEMAAAMRSHLRLHHSVQDEAEERVLSVLPASLRRRVMRHTFAAVLEDSWLLEGTHPGFVDALLVGAKIENVTAKVDIIGPGDRINELIFLVAGTCTLQSPHAPGNPHAGAAHTSLDMDGSGHGGSSGSGSPRGGCMWHNLGPGEPLAAFSFFTETPALQGARTSCVCRVLSVPRTTYSTLASSFPVSAERVLTNLLEAAQELVERELKLPYAALRPSLDAPGSAPDLAALAMRYASPELIAAEGGGGVARRPARRPQFVPVGAVSPPGLPSSASTDDWEADMMAAFARRTGRPLDTSQRMALSNLVRVRMLVEAQRRRLQRERTAEFLEAAAAGNTGQLRAMLQQGLSPDSADYDGRTALMLAAGHGHTEAVELLLAAGADPSRADALQSCPLLEAARGGHDAAVEALVGAGAKVTLPQVAAAAHLCSAVFEGDVPLLRRLLRAGLDQDGGDYDGRRPLHIAAAESSLPALKVLVEEAGADTAVKDRWGLTALDEARRGGSAAAVAFLEAASGPAGAATPGRPHDATPV